MTDTHSNSKPDPSRIPSEKRLQWIEINLPQGNCCHADTYDLIAEIRRLRKIIALANAAAAPTDAKKILYWGPE